MDTWIALEEARVEGGRIYKEMRPSDASILMRNDDQASLLLRPERHENEIQSSFRIAQIIHVACELPNLQRSKDAYA